MSTPQRRNVDFVLLAEFDIDRGSVLRYEYPAATSVKPSELAEAMLPEGAHLRESDWTVWFIPDKALHFPAAAAADPGSTSGEDAAPAAATDEKADEAANAHASGGVSGSSARSPLSCCLSLVRTKMDKTVRRGAIVKAIAIITRFRFPHAFKPLLSAALDKYLSLPHTGPSAEASEEARTAEESSRLAVLEQLYRAINSIDIAATLPSYTPLQQRLLGASLLRELSLGRATNSVSTTVLWDSTRLPVALPCFQGPDETTEASLTALVQRFGEGVMRIFTALLCEKRVLFLGYQQPAQQVANAVLSACLLISPVIQGTLSRAFPYANLTNLDFLNVPGYIAGVTNPLFEQRTQWWDVLANLSTGEVTLSPSYADEPAAAPAAAPGQSSAPSSSSSSSSSGAAPAGGSSGSGSISATSGSALDQAFIAEVMQGIKLRASEEWVRCMFRDLTQHIVGLAHDEEQFPDAATRSQHLDAYGPRLTLFLRSRQYQAFARARRSRPQQSAFREMDAVVRHHVRSLQVRAVPAAEMIAVYSDFLKCVPQGAQDEVLEFLALLPESQGGLFPIAAALFHKHPRVRASAVELLKRIDAVEQGRQAISALNYYMVMTYYRYVKAGAGAGAGAASAPHESDGGAGAGAGHVTVAGAAEAEAETEAEAEAQAGTLAPAGDAFEPPAPTAPAASTPPAEVMPPEAAEGYAKADAAALGDGLLQPSDLDAEAALMSDLQLAEQPLPEPPAG